MKSSKNGDRRTIFVNNNDNLLFKVESLYTKCNFDKNRTQLYELLKRKNYAKKSSFV